MFQTLIVSNNLLSSVAFLITQFSFINFSVVLTSFAALNYKYSLLYFCRIFCIQVVELVQLRGAQRTLSSSSELMFVSSYTQDFRVDILCFNKIILSFKLRSNEYKRLPFPKEQYQLGTLMYIPRYHPKYRRKISVVFYQFAGNQKIPFFWGKSFRF